MLCVLTCTYAVGQVLQQRPRYTLHSGDTVDLTLRFTPEYNQSLTVQPDGFINVNLIVTEGKWSDARTGAHLIVENAVPLNKLG